MTTFEALYMGVPVISLYGSRHGTRFGYSMLQNAGIGELAAAAPEEYINKAVGLAQDENLVSLLHENLRHMVMVSPLMDTAEYVRQMEKLYENIWQEKRKDTFIHHFGSMSFRKSYGETAMDEQKRCCDEPMDRNRQLFRKKWHIEGSLEDYRCRQMKEEEAYRRIEVKYGQAGIPLVSVMIPTFNRPELFGQSLASVRRQTYPNIEIIICDNSTDERTAELMQKYLDDSRIQYHRNREARTKAENFQPFEQLAKGEFLQWLMDDDLLEPDKITRMVAAFAEHPNVRLAASNRRWIDLEGRDLEHPVRLEAAGSNRDYAVFSGQELGRLMLCQSQNYIGEPSSVLFRRRDLQHHYWRAECRGYAVISDVVMWLELLEQGDCAYFREPLSSYRRHDGQEGQSPAVILRSRVEWFRIIAEYYQKGQFLVAVEDFKTAIIQLLRDAETVLRHPVFQQNEIRQTAEWREYQELLQVAGEIVGNR